MAAQQKIQVVIVDDHDMVRRGLSHYIKATSDIELVGEASDGEDTLQVCLDTRPDVVLMDLVMPKVGGIEATRAIRQRCPNVRVIALTSFQERELVQEALHAGAISYLLKNVTGEDLAQAIRAACAGRPTIAPEVAQAFVLISRDPQPGEDLTSREREVLSLLVEGFNNPEIARRLVISRSTARAHVSNIFLKLGVTNRSEAVALALRKRLIR